LFSSPSWNVGSIRKIALVNTLNGPNNLAQPRDDLWWRYPSAENALSRDGRCVEISIRPLSLDKHGPLQRKICEEVWRAHKFLNRPIKSPTPGNEQLSQVRTSQFGVLKDQCGVGQIRLDDSSPNHRVVIFGDGCVHDEAQTLTIE